MKEIKSQLTSFITDFPDILSCPDYKQAYVIPFLCYLLYGRQDKITTTSVIFPGWEGPTGGHPIGNTVLCFKVMWPHVRPLELQMLPPLCGVEKRAFPRNTLAPTPTMWSFVRRPRSLPLQKQGGDFFHPWICVCMCRLPHYIKIAMLGLLSDMWGPVMGINFIFREQNILCLKSAFFSTDKLFMSTFLSQQLFLIFLVYLRSIFCNIYLFCVLFPKSMLHTC